MKALWTFLLCSIFLVGVQAEDLVTRSGQTYAGFRVTGVERGKVTIAYLQKDGSPNVAVIPYSELPDALRQRFPGAAPMQFANGTFESELQLLADSLNRELAALKPDADAEKKQLLQQVRMRVNRLTAMYAQEADFRIVSSDRMGVLLEVVGTGRNAAFRSGQYIFVLGGKSPGYNSFKWRIFPGGVKAAYGKYNNVLYYGINEHYASEIALDALGRSVGNALLFRTSVPEPAQETRPATAEKVVVNNIYIPERRRRHTWSPFVRYHVGPVIPIRPDWPEPPEPFDPPDIPDIGGGDFGE